MISVSAETLARQDAGARHPPSDPANEEWQQRDICSTFLAALSPNLTSATTMFLKSLRLFPRSEVSPWLIQLPRLTPFYQAPRPRSGSNRKSEPRNF